MGSRQALLLRKLRESTLPNNPYMSPLRASDDILRQFPTTYLVVSYFVLSIFFSHIYSLQSSMCVSLLIKNSFLRISGVARGWKLPPNPAFIVHRSFSDEGNCQTPKNPFVK